MAILIALREGRVPEDPLHREKYIARRCLGAMIDAQRAAWRQQPPYVGELSDINAVSSASIEQPDRLLQMRQAVARLFGHDPRVADCMNRLAGGDDCQTVAAQMGVSPSRVSQFRTRARAIVSACW
jgi:DNA-binding CsgD family transcriptional regulator